MADSVFGGEVASASIAGLTSYNPILIKYTGDSPVGGTITVDAATGDITLKTGPVGGSTADLTVVCPPAAPATGILDVSNAACNTLGEVVDAINASPNWTAVIQDGLRTDSSDNTLAVLAETSATKPEGLALAGDSAVSLQATILAHPKRNDIRLYTNGARMVGDTKLRRNPFIDSKFAAVYANATLAGTGADTVSLTFATPTNKNTTASASAVTSSATETVDAVISKPGGGTTVNSVFDFANFPIFGRKGQRLLFRCAFATTVSAVTTMSFGAVAYPANRAV